MATGDLETSALPYEYPAICSEIFFMKCSLAFDSPFFYLKRHGAAVRVNRPSSVNPGCSSGRRPKGPWKSRSCSLMARSLMRACRNFMSPLAANSPFSFPVVGEPHSDPVLIERLKLLDGAVVKLRVPLPCEKSDDRFLLRISFAPRDTRLRARGWPSPSAPLADARDREFPSTFFRNPGLRADPLRCQ